MQQGCLPSTIPTTITTIPLFSLTSSHLPLIAPTTVTTLEQGLTNLTHHSTHSHPEPDACRSKYFFTPSAYKIVKRICEGQYIDMADLLPESLATLMANNPSPSKDKSKKWKNTINTITAWVECFATYTSIPSQHSSSRTQDLLVYMTTIVRAARKYKGNEWQTYDTIFRQQAVHHAEHKWAKVNPSLWTTVFCNATQQDHYPQLIRPQSSCLSWDRTHFQPK